MNEALHQAMAEIAVFLAAHPAVGNWYTAIARFLFPVLAVLILLRAVRSLLRLPTTPILKPAAYRTKRSTTTRLPGITASIRK